ncbi:MAG: HEAT repeat domain-containing protein [Cyanobacteria bacterium P01_A01_bin.84]
MTDKTSIAVERKKLSFLPLVISQTSPTSASPQNRISAKPIVVTELVEQLRTADITQRRKIIRQLSESKPDMVPKLVQAMSDPDPLVKSGVAEVLGNLTDAAVPAIPALIEMTSNTQRAIVPSPSLFLPSYPVPRTSLPPLSSLPRRSHHFLKTQERRIPPDPPKNPENLLRITAIAALGKIGLPARTAATPVLIEALKDSDPWVKLNATWALAEIGASTPVLSYWLKAIQHPDPRLRRSAAEIFQDSRSLLRKVFGSEADASTTAPLIVALKDEDFRVRNAAKEGLELLGTKALPGLVQGLKAPEPIIRLEAAKLLGNMGGIAQSAVPTLVELLRDTGRYVPLNRNRYYSFSYFRLPRVPQFSVGRKYFPAPDNPERLVRVNAAIALGKLRDPRAIPTLTTALKDNNPWMQLATSWALLRLGQNKGLPVVGRLVQYPKSSVQDEALSQLKYYGSQAAPYVLPYYRPLLDSTDDNKRNGAIIRIGKMGVGALNLVPKLRIMLTSNQKNSSGYAATILGQIARDTAVAGQNGNLSPQQRQQAIAEFTKVLRIMEAPNARFNRQPRDRIRNALTRLQSIR